MCPASVRAWAQPGFEQLDDARARHRGRHRKVGRAADADDQRLFGFDADDFARALELPWRGRRTAAEAPQKARVIARIARMFGPPHRFAQRRRANASGRRGLPKPPSLGDRDEGMEVARVVRHCSPSRTARACRGGLSWQCANRCRQQETSDECNRSGRLFPIWRSDGEADRLWRHAGCRAPRVRTAPRPGRRSGRAPRRGGDRRRSPRHQRSLRPAHHEPADPRGALSLSRRSRDRHQARCAARGRRIVASRLWRGRPCARGRRQSSQPRGRSARRRRSAHHVQRPGACGRIDRGLAPPPSRGTA